MLPEPLDFYDDAECPHCGEERRGGPRDHRHLHLPLRRVRPGTVGAAPTLLRARLLESVVIPWWWLVPALGAGAVLGCVAFFYLDGWRYQ